MKHDQVEAAVTMKKRVMAMKEGGEIMAGDPMMMLLQVLYMRDHLLRWGGKLKRLVSPDIAIGKTVGCNHCGSSKRIWLLLQMRRSSKVQSQFRKLFRELTGKSGNMQ